MLKPWDVTRLNQPVTKTIQVSENERRNTWDQITPTKQIFDNLYSAAILNGWKNTLAGVTDHQKEVQRIIKFIATPMGLWGNIRQCTVDLRQI